MSHTPERAPLGTIVAQERRRLGLSQQELADLAGVSFALVNRVENDHTGIRFELLHKLLAVLGLTIVLRRKQPSGLTEDFPLD